MAVQFYVISCTCIMYSLAEGASLRSVCSQQDAFLPGVTKASVADGIASRFGLDSNEVDKGRSLSGWYLQQV